MILKDKMDSFTAPRPIFKAALTPNKSVVILECIDSTKGPPRIQGEHLHNLLSGMYHVTFDAKNGGYNLYKENTVARAANSIIVDLLSFLETHQKLKNPRQSRTYKWLAYSTNWYETDRFDGLVLVWEYMMKENAKLTSDHVQNILAIIEAIRSKDEAANKNTNK
jgi:hypothetical protein